MHGYFKIIIPNYNNAEWLNKSISSVLSQTFKDFVLLIVDDCSTDNSVEIIKSFQEKDDRIYLVEATHKLYNGGARNVGIRSNKAITSEYTLFLDSDDWYDNEWVLENIYNFIQANNNPDCVSLSYNCVIGNTYSPQILMRPTPKELVDSLYVACWTKCIKTDLVVLFPENTLMEDVVQHIKQVDNIETIACYDKPVINWNRNNTNSCSRVENQNLQQGKWQSSMYRYAADLMDTHCSHDYCEAHRKWRLEIALNNIKEGKYIQ